MFASIELILFHHLGIVNCLGENSFSLARYNSCMALHPLGTLGNLYPLGLNPGAVALLLVRCIPCIHITSLAPALAIAHGAPALEVAQTLPMLALVQLAPALALVAMAAGLEVRQLVPGLVVEDCDC